MIGQLLEVSSRGEVNDTYFQNIRYEKYIYVVKRTTRFSNYVREVSTNERVDFGRTITYDIPKLGDFLWKMHLEVVLPDLSAKSEEAKAIAESRGLTFVGPQFYWIHEIGNHIFERVELLIDGVTICHYTNNYAMLKMQEKSNPDNEHYLREIIGQDKQSVYGEKVIYVPLHFWSTEEIHRALPLFKMENTRIQIRCKIRSLDELVISNMLLDSRNTEIQYTAANASSWIAESLASSVSSPMIKFTGARYFGENPADQNLPQIYGYNGILSTKQGEYIPEVDNGPPGDYALTSCLLICHCFDIGNEEKSLMADKTHQLYQIQELYYPGKSIRGDVLSELIFSNPVAHLHWFYRDPTAISVYNNYVNVSKKHIVTTTKVAKYPEIPTVDTYQYVNLPPFYNMNAEWLDSAKIKITNQDRQEENASVFRDIVYQTRKGIHASGYQRFLYSYHFGKEIQERNSYSSCLNFDKLSKLYLESRFHYDEQDSGRNANIHILVESLNVMVFSGGKASLLFDSP